MRGPKVLVPLGAEATGANGYWGEPGPIGAMVRSLRDAHAAAGERRLPAPVSVACLQGRTARVAMVPGGFRDLAAGERMSFTMRPTGPDSAIPLAARDLARDITRGERLVCGALDIEVDEVRGTDLRCRVIAGGRLRADQQLYLPATERSCPAFHDEDRAALEAALVAGFDWIALPDVRTADDVRELRSTLRAREATALLAAVLHPAAPLSEAHHLCTAVDALVLDRDALASAVPPETLLATIDAWLTAARTAGCVTIVKGSLLTSLATGPRPSVADLTDLAHLATFQPDCIVLDSASAHACGVARALLSAPTPSRLEPRVSSLSPEESLAAAAALSSATAACLVVHSRTGSLALRLARFRPQPPILALLPRGGPARRLALVHGVTAVEVDALAADELPAVAARLAQELDLARPGGTLAVVTTDESAPAAAPLALTLCRVESPGFMKPRKPHSVVVPGARRA